VRYESRLAFIGPTFALKMHPCDSCTCFGRNTLKTLSPPRFEERPPFHASGREKWRTAVFKP
jgi:hypothetical protein